MPLFCKSCGERVRIHEMREHQEAHNAGAKALSWAEIQSCYEHKNLEEVKKYV